MADEMTEARALEVALNGLHERHERRRDERLSDEVRREAEEAARVLERAELRRAGA